MATRALLNWLNELNPTTRAFAVLWTLSAGVYLLFALYRTIFGFKAGRKLPPGPWFHFPLLGDSVHLAAGNPVKFFFERFKRYGPVYRTQMLGSRIWVVADTGALRPPLNDQGAFMQIPFRSFRALMGEDSFIRDTSFHGPWRKLFGSALGPPQLSALVPRIEAVMREHLAAWEAVGRINIFREARLLGLDLAVDVITRVDLPPDVDRAWFKGQVEVFLDGLVGLPLRLPGTALWRALAARERLVRVLVPHMAEQHARFTQEWKAAGEDVARYAAARQEQQTSCSGVTAATAATAPAPASPDDVSASTAAGAPASNASASNSSSSSSSSSPAGPPSMIEAQWAGWAAIGRGDLVQAAHSVLHLLVASGDTTRTALFNTWALLAVAPRVQDELFQEQKKVMEQHGPELSYQALCAMPYMDATMKECMRLLPAAFGGFRRLTADLPVGDYVIPAGEVIWYVTGLLHCLDPVLWDGDTSGYLPTHMDWQRNLEGAFRPERWLGGGGGGGGGSDGGSDGGKGQPGDVRPRTLSTFGMGSHLCLGMNLVYLEVKLLLALVLRKYRLRPETPDMLRRCRRLFPFFVPERGTDGVLLVPRAGEAAAVVAAA
ncbi:hypothetical protein PLESTM_000375200 [Pleodorina starrii]|nr:hypothetical protein PLESTM_000375100 [Pleodorina starrii]GLC35849.1 hypothetical protein PLESTM_000375200 [Pleodorina starrii]